MEKKNSVCGTHEGHEMTFVSVFQAILFLFEDI